LNDREEAVGNALLGFHVLKTEIFVLLPQDITKHSSKEHSSKTERIRRERERENRKKQVATSIRNNASQIVETASIGREQESQSDRQEGWLEEKKSLRRNTYRRQRMAGFRI
jgi:hypothetical protein